MAADFTIKLNDVLPVLKATLRDAEGRPINLTGASAVFRMRPSGGGALKVNAAANIISAGGGTVQYAWLTGDTDTAGFFNGEFVLSYSGSLLSIPNASTFVIQVFAGI